MSQALHLQACTACSAEQSRLPSEQWPALLNQLQDWAIDQSAGHPQLVKDYVFANFQQAMEFVHQVALLAENEQHHPKILIEWGHVHLSWWTHRTQSLALNDFILAARCDQLRLGTDQ